MFGFHHVQLACPAGAENRLRAFYAGILGMTEVAKPPVLAARGGVWFRSGPVEIHFGVEDDFRAARKAHPGLLVPGELRGLAERLVSSGYPVTWDDALPGVARFYSADPVGNRLEFLTTLSGVRTRAA